MCRSFLNSLIVCVLICGLNACKPFSTVSPSERGHSFESGNGEGYAGGIPTPPQDPEDTIDGQAQDTPAVLSYEWLDPNYTCSDPLTGAPRSSYRNRIGLDIGSATLEGDSCSAESQVEINFDDVEIFRFTGHLLGFQEGIYTFVPESGINGPQTLTETWCGIGDDVQDGLDVLIQYREDTPDQLQATVFVGSNYFPGAQHWRYVPPFGVSKEVVGNSVVYSFDSFHLVLDRSHFVNGTSKYPGSMRIQIDGRLFQRNFECRNF